MTSAYQVVGQDEHNVRLSCSCSHVANDEHCQADARRYSANRRHPSPIFRGIVNWFPQRDVLFSFLTIQLASQLPRTNLPIFTTIDLLDRGVLIAADETSSLKAAFSALATSPWRKKTLTVSNDQSPVFDNNAVKKVNKSCYLSFLYRATGSRDEHSTGRQPALNCSRARPLSRDDGGASLPLWGTVVFAACTVARGFRGLGRWHVQIVELPRVF